MKTNQIEIIDSAADLPQEWDEAAGDRFFLKRKSLLVLEEVNPCGQRYHIAEGPGRRSIAVTYRHKLNLLTYGAGSLSIPVTIIGVPCSVSSSGCGFAAGTAEAMILHLRQMPGPKLVLNADDGAMAGFASGTTLPTCRLDVRWSDFASYLSSMRSHYRYKIKQAQSRWAQVAAVPAANEGFGEDLYTLYQNVYRRSRYKLEMLSIDFFRKFPADIVAFKAGGKAIAFVQTVRSGSELIFMFTGMDYSTAKKYATYLNVLLYIIRTGIDAGCSTIDMGQTTEEMKCKLGCRLVEKRLHAAHPNRVGNLVLKMLIGALSYKPKVCDYHVFK